MQCVLNVGRNDAAPQWKQCFHVGLLSKKMGGGLGCDYSIALSKPDRTSIREEQLLLPANHEGRCGASFVGAGAWAGAAGAGVAGGIQIDAQCGAVGNDQLSGGVWMCRGIGFAM